MAYTYALNGYDRLVIYLVPALVAFAIYRLGSMKKGSILVLVLAGLYLLSTMHHVRFFH